MIDEKIYSVIIVGWDCRKGNLTVAEAEAETEKLIRLRAENGWRGAIRIIYRTGEVVSEH